MSEILERLDDRYDRFERFVNRDVAHLLGALGALVVRYRETGLTAAEQADQQSKEAVLWAIERGKSRATQHMAVSLWAALEAYLEDVWITAAREVSIDGKSPLAKVKASIVELQGMTDAEQYRKLWKDVPTSKLYGVDRYSKVFEMIKVEVSVKSIEARRSPIPQTVGGVQVTDQWMRTVLHELREVRNVIVHRGGIVDARLVATSDGRWKLGDELDIEDEWLIDYGIAVHTYAASALSAVADVLQLPLEYDG